MYMGIYGSLNVFDKKTIKIYHMRPTMPWQLHQIHQYVPYFVVDRPIVHRRTIDIAIKDKSTIGVQYRLTDRTMTVSSNQPLPFDLEGAHQGDGRKLTFEKLLVISNNDLDNPPL